MDSVRSMLRNRAVSAPVTRDLEVSCFPRRDCRAEERLAANIDELPVLVEELDFDREAARCRLGIVLQRAQNDDFIPTQDLFVSDHSYTVSGGERLRGLLHDLGGLR